CLFVPRCPFSTERCERETPVLGRDGGPGQETEQEHACFHPRRRSVIPVGVGE
ncbi:ABC transporter ATP-binding protein, partial [Microbispora triticiradicis]|nr:ABC transporter ATP-binding protein [Microbispora triticiradicis]